VETLTGGNLTHFYHVYAGGEWHDPVREHVEALEKSFLNQHLKKMYVGYVGSDKEIEEAEKYISYHVPAVTIARSPTGWEQETMRNIQSLLSDGPVLYAHSKGASDPSPINIAWRRSMTLNCVINWRSRLVDLMSHDTSGCHWLQAEDGKWFYGGTYWWANSEYLKTLPDVGEESRFMAEHWIGLNPQVKAYDILPNIHPGQTPLDTDWRTSMSDLKKIYEKYSYPGGWGDKGTAHNYLPTYERYMQQRDNVTVLEIGVMRGHSIKMWNEYFKNSQVIGIDISLTNLEFQLDNVYVCDGTKVSDVDAMFSNVTFDYVVDDGSHFVQDQLASLDVFLPRMNPGGVYFIEDIAGDEPLALIEQRLSGHDYEVIDGRGPGMPADEIMVVVKVPIKHSN
jgi:hypothetical protein